MKHFLLILFAALCLPVLPSARAASETPPQGAPWTKDLFEAHRMAFEQGKPIFIYSTKTH